MQRTAVCIVTILTNPIVFSSYKSINLLYANILVCLMTILISQMYACALDS